MTTPHCFLDLGPVEQVEYLARELAEWRAEGFRTPQFARRWMRRVRIAAAACEETVEETLGMVEVLADAVEVARHASSRWMQSRSWQTCRAATDRMTHRSPAEQVDARFFGPEHFPQEAPLGRQSGLMYDYRYDSTSAFTSANDQPLLERT